MTVPGMPSNVAPPGDDWIPKKFKQLEWEIAQLRTAIPYAMASRNFDGTLEPPAPGTQGWALTADGNAIVNTLYLRGGIIGNDALTSPVFPAKTHGDAQSFAIPHGTMTTVATATISVPSGYSSCLVFATSQVTGQNSTAAYDTLSVGITIAGVVVPGWAASMDVPASHVGTGTTAGSSLLTSLGSSFTVTARCQSLNANWASSIWNTANIDAIALFLR